MKLLSILMLSLFTFGTTPTTIEDWKLDDLQTYIHNDKDVTYIVNFWATWCAPCVKEMPYFEALEKKYADDESVEVVLVSLDFAGSKESRLAPFVKKQKIKSKVVHFLEKKPNYWIPKISDKWSGSIPATLVVNDKQGVYDFYEQSFHSLKELEGILK